MNLINVNCPSCGAALEVNSDLRSAACNYCGKQFILDSENVHVEMDLSESAGYKFEIGRIKARKESEENERRKAEMLQEQNRRSIEEKLSAVDEYEAVVARMKRSASLKVSVFFTFGLIFSAIGLLLIFLGAAHYLSGEIYVYIGAGLTVLALICALVIMRTARRSRIKCEAQAMLIFLVAAIALGKLIYSYIV